MEGLYAVGETSCNGVHGRNRLASNSLLESLVFSRSAAEHIRELEEEKNGSEEVQQNESIDFSCYEDAEALRETYKTMILNEMERMQKEHV